MYAWKASAASYLSRWFDFAFEEAYGDGESLELPNLARLFDGSAIRNYEAALRHELMPGAKASIDIAWIDKRPIAYIDRNKTGAELGDMMIVVNDYHRNGSLIESRACLLEVKQAPAGRLPPVPVTTGASTKNQLQILSTWPCLDVLKQTGANDEYLLENIDVKRNSKPTEIDSQVWYVAVMKKSRSGPSPMPWRAAPPLHLADFEHSLGEIFDACVRNTTLSHIGVKKTLGVGRRFASEEQLPPRPDPGWDELIRKIIYTTRQYALPPSLFAFPQRSRYLGGRVITGFQAMGISIPPSASSLSLDWASYAAGIWTGITLAFITRGVGPLLYRKLRDRCRANWLSDKFPVITFHIHSSE